VGDDTKSNTPFTMDIYWDPKIDELQLF